MPIDMQRDAVEPALTHRLTFELNDELRRSVDRRVRAAIAADRRYTPTARGRRQITLTPRVIVGVALATILLAGTAVAAGSLFDRLVGGAALLEDVWARATVVGKSVTDAGYTVTLERAALDRDRLWVAVSVTSGGQIWAMRVTDSNGVALTGGTGAGTGVRKGQSAELFGFRIPDGMKPHGPFTLEITELEVAGVQTHGTWRFVFDVPTTRAEPASSGT